MNDKQRDDYFSHYLMPCAHPYPLRESAREAVKIIVPGIQFVKAIIPMLNSLLRDSPL